MTLSHQCPDFLACPLPERRHGLTRAPTRLDDDQWLPTDGNLKAAGADSSSQLSSLCQAICHSEFRLQLPSHTATNIRFMYSQKRVRPYSHFHIHVSVRDLYIPRIDPHIFLQTDRLWEYINRSQTHECRNWDWGRAILFLGIFVLNFRYWFFAVQYRTSLPPLFLSPASKLAKTPIRVDSLVYVFSFGLDMSQLYANYFTYLQNVQYCYCLVPNLFHNYPNCHIPVVTHSQTSPALIKGSFPEDKKCSHIINYQD